VAVKFDREIELFSNGVPGEPYPRYPQRLYIMTSCIRRREEAVEAFRTAFEAQAVNGEARVRDMTSYLNVADNTVYKRLSRMRGEFELKDGKIRRIAGKGGSGSIE